MELTHQQMIQVAEEIAADNPRILLNALRANGFWLYAIEKHDLENAFNGTPNADMLPVTNDDMYYINMRDKRRSIVSYNVPFDKVIEDMTIQIRDIRNMKNDSESLDSDS